MYIIVIRAGLDEVFSEPRTFKFQRKLSTTDNSFIKLLLLQSITNVLPMYIVVLHYDISMNQSI